MSISRFIFRAIHEGRWLSIEYVNAENKTTYYWISILNIIIINKNGEDKAKLEVMGLHLKTHVCTRLGIFFDGIKQAQIIEGSYAARNNSLLHELNENPTKYSCLFSNIHNIKILTYLQECQKLSSDNYEKSFGLLEHLDESKFLNGCYQLTQEECDFLIDYFKKKASKKSNSDFTPIELFGLNTLSIKTLKGLYVLAFKELLFDIQNKQLILSKNSRVLTRFILKNQTLDNVVKVSNYLYEEDLYLLKDFDENEKTIKELILKHGNLKSHELLDDMPHIIALESKSPDLTIEYDAITKSVSDGSVSTPLRAFFGDLLRPSRNTKNYPIVLMDDQVNLDQLLAIHKSLKYPITYIQGPPGTGKTKTIANTMISALFNKKTVLLSSQNNHPINGAFKILSSITIDDKIIPFPILRLGNNNEVKKSIQYIKNIFEYTKSWTIKNKALDDFTEIKIENTAKLAEYLENYEDKLDLLERKETIEDFLNQNQNFNVNMNVQSKQLREIEKQISAFEEISDEKVKFLLPNDFQKFLFYLRYLSAQYIQRLKEPKYKELLKILELEDQDDAVKKLNHYLREDGNLHHLLRVFPIIATTNQSAKKLASPSIHFDLTIVDEASQCDVAMALLPILRGQNLMLVGDPQQLNPVITLDDLDNNVLIRKYNIAPEYDYKNNSIYKTFLAADSISDEVLLSHHYRSAKEIISFNNKKYYNNKLLVKTEKRDLPPLIFQETPNENPVDRNTSYNEALSIVDYVKKYPDKSIGVITPFVAQKARINMALIERGLEPLCGTVHEFQGDEKDIILFSFAITQKTSSRTYEWFSKNKELINVAVSRAKEELVLFSNTETLNRLHTQADDLYELVQYVKTNGDYKVTPKHSHSRALGLKPYSTKTESDFFININHVLSVVDEQKKYTIKTEVPIAQVFENNTSGNTLFYSGRFDFVLYEKDGRTEIPILAIELDGEEHRTNENRIKCDQAKELICDTHDFTLIRIPNSYARRYSHIKEILVSYFKK